MNRRLWNITSINENGDRILLHALYDKDEVAQILNDFDIKGYFISSWTFNCDFDSSYLVRVELEVRFGNFCIDNIAELMGRIIGEE